MHSDRGLVNHVRIVAILMMVQGGLEVMMGIFMIVLAAFMPSALSQVQANQQNNEMDPKTMGWVLLATYGSIGLAMFIASGLHIFAGIRLYQFRSRVLGIVALSFGILTIMSCYCFPTAVGLAIYGLIVLLNGPVVEAFRMRTAGASSQSVLQSTPLK